MFLEVINENDSNGNNFEIVTREIDVLGFHNTERIEKILMITLLKIFSN